MEDAGTIRIDVGPERIVLTDGLQPYLVRTAAGTLVAQGQLSFPPGYRRPEKNAFPGIPGTVVSRDNGESWERWQPAPEQGEGPTFEGAAAALEDGTLLWIDWIADGPSPSGDFTVRLWESRDDFRSVEGPILATIHLPQAKAGFDDNGHPYSGVTFHRSLLPARGGELLASIYCWFKEDETPSSYLPSMCKYRCVLLRSTDRGRHWQHASTIAADPTIGQEGFDEPALIRLATGPKAGRLLCLMRTGSTSCPIYEAHSDDDGATWSPPRALEFCGVDPDLIEMADGTLACSFGWRTRDHSAPEFGNYLAFSLDQGETWSHQARWPVEPHASVKSTTCYTGLREVAPGRLLVLYDIGLWRLPVRYVAGREMRVERG